MAYLQLGVDPVRTTDAVDKAYADALSGNLLSITTWETWLSDDYNDLLSVFGMGTSSSTPVVQQAWVTDLETDLSDLLSASTWETWLSGDWTTFLSWFGLTPSTTSTTPTIPQSYVTDLETDLSEAITTGDYTPLLELLFGSGTTTVPSSGTPIAVAAVPGLPTTKITSGQFAASIVADVLGGSSLGADVQAILDTISNALGHSGTGHTLTQVLGYLGLIPPANVTNVLGTSSLATDVQAILDYIANALGHSGTGHTLANIETYLGLIPAANVTNVLGGANLGADVTALEAGLAAYLTTGSFQALLDAIANSLGHTGTGHTTTQIETYLGLIPPANVSNVLGGASLGADVAAVSMSLYGGTTVGSTVQVSAIPTGIPQNSISGLVTSLSSLLGTTTFQNLLDAISNALGYAGTGYTITEVETYLGLIPPTNVTGIGGATSLATATQSIMDYLTQAFTGAVTTGNSFGQLANAASGTANTASAAQMVAQAATTVQAQQTAAKAAWNALGDVTADVTFPAGPTYTLSAMPTIAVTQTNSVIGYITTSDNVNKLSVMFVAETVGTVTGVYINIYTVGAAGLCTKVIAGSNIVSEIGTLEAVIYDDFASALPVTPAEQYAVEVVMTGTGSLTMFGLSPTWAPTNSLVLTGSGGGTRAAIATVTENAVGAGSNGSSTSPVTKTELHTAAVGADVFVWGTAHSSSTAVSWSATCGGTAMTLESSVSVDGIASQGSLAAFRLAGAGTGSAQTVSVTATSSGTTFLTINSMSYANVASLGTITTADGSSTSPSVGGTGVSQGIVVGAIATNTNATITGLNAAFTQRSLQDTSGIGGLIIGDSATTGSLTFGATFSSISSWAAITMVLLPGVAAPVPTTFTPTSSGNIPFFALSANGGTTTPVFAPETTSYTTNGTYTYTLPTWFNLGVDYLDSILLSPGGGGGGGIPNPGSTGSNTTVTVGGTTVTAAAGAGGSSGNTTKTGAIGASPGNISYNSQPYYGGGTSAYGYGIDTVGSSPGGGGAGGGTGGSYGYGGSAGTWVTHTFNPTGPTVSVTVGAGGAASPFYGAENGADGAVWLVARQA